MMTPIVKFEITNRQRLKFILLGLFLIIPVFVLENNIIKILSGLLSGFALISALLGSSIYFYENHFTSKAVLSKIRDISYAEIQKFKTIQNENDFTPPVTFVLYTSGRKYRFILDCMEAEKLIPLLEQNNIEKCD